MAPLIFPRNVHHFLKPHSENRRGCLLFVGCVLTHQPTSQHHHRLTDPRPNRQYNPLKKSAKPFKKTIDICTDIYIMHGTDSNAP